MNDDKPDKIDVNVTENAVKTRREIYDLYFENKNQIPDGWHFNKKTVYSDHPTLVKNFHNKKAIIRINVFGDNIKIQGMTENSETGDLDNFKEMSESNVKVAVNQIINTFILYFESDLKD